MHNTLPLLQQTSFPALTRKRIETLQINLGYLCNQSCLHCHVNAGPKRKELMGRETIDTILAFLDQSNIGLVDLTGGAPEMNPLFRVLVSELRRRGCRVMNRCNLTILEESGQEGLAEFLAEQGVEVTASLPCYLEDNVDRQRGNGVFASSVRGLKRLNALGYGHADSGLELNLVYNPQGPVLPPPQASLEADYKRHLYEEYGVVFNRLFTLTNMPIQRFGSTLISKGQFNDYMDLLRSAYQEENCEAVMCRNLLSIDWQGYVYDCDFNQMLGLPLRNGNAPRTHIRDIIGRELDGRPIIVGDHCYGCTAGQGSSCGGSLEN